MAFVEQVDAVSVNGGCPCGCATVDFIVDRSAPSAGKTYRPIPNEAEVLDADGAYMGGVIVFTENGYLSSLEIFSIADPITQLPPLDRLRLVSR